MYVEVIHANGTYFSDSETHHQREDRSQYFQTLQWALPRLLQQGAQVVYRPNMPPSCEADLKVPRSLVARAVATDPILSSLERDVLTQITVLPDNVSDESDYLFDTIANIEALGHEQAVVIGAYTTLCVAERAMHMREAMPDMPVAIDPALSLSWHETVRIRRYEEIPKISLIEQWMPLAA